MPMCIYGIFASTVNKSMIIYDAEQEMKVNTTVKDVLERGS